jgi:alpha,alpha-trehalase
MQSTIHHISREGGADVHAPASTYYTTGQNAGGYVRRLKTFGVRL